MNLIPWKTLISMMFLIITVIEKTNCAPLMFPLTIGGFSGNTVIEMMIMTPQQKLFIAGYSWDK
jgi:hypothetical protein